MVLVKLIWMAIVSGCHRLPQITGSRRNAVIPAQAGITSKSTSFRGLLHLVV